MEPQGRLYALLVGINTYRHFPERFYLEGCHNDVKAISGLLNEPFIREQFAAVHIHPPLLDEKAEKDGIIQAFKQHFASVQAGDTVLFYFSGHGIREKTDVLAFRRGEVDGPINALVCYDSDFSIRVGEERNNGKFIADKELRYLIKPISDRGAHVITIFDNCHAAGISRSLPKLKARQLEYRAIPARANTDWAFLRDSTANVNMDRLRTDPMSLNEELPQGEHVELAACRAWEQAWEDTDKDYGLFTHALVDIVKTHKGEISYYELQGRLSNRVRVRDTEMRGQRVQIPQLYTFSRTNNMRYQSFLGQKSPADTSSQVAASYNEYEREWRIQAGGLQGLVKGQEVKVFAKSRPEKIYLARISELLVTQSVIAFVEERINPRDIEGNIWLAEVKIKAASLRIKLSGDAKGLQMLRQAIAERPFIQLDDQYPDYVLIAKAGEYHITLPGDSRLIVRKLNYEVNGVPQPIEVNLMARWLTQMARWNFLKNLKENPLNRFGFDYPIQLRAFQYEIPDSEDWGDRLTDPANWNILPIQADQLPIHMTHDLDTLEPYTHIGFSLKNTSEEPWFVAVLILNSSFGVFMVEFGKTSEEMEYPFYPKRNLTSLDQKEIALPPGAEVQIVIKYKDSYFFSNILEPQIPAYIMRDHWAFVQDTLKLIISRQSLNLDAADLQMQDLPEPMARLETYRKITRPSKKVPMPDWSVLNLDLIYLVPDR